MDNNSRNKIFDIEYDEMASENRTHEQRATVIFENLHTAAERVEMTMALADAMTLLSGEELLGDYLLAAMMVFQYCDTDVLPILNKKKMLH